MEYVVNLVEDPSTTSNPLNIDWPESYNQSIEKLAVFLKSNGGRFLGWFNYKGTRYFGQAVIDVTETTIEKLYSLNIDLLENESEEPFLNRIDGYIFDIAPKEGIEIVEIAA